MSHWKNELRLPEGVIRKSFVRHADDRGDLIEMFRQDWPGQPSMKQWNASHNGPNVFRGMHVHPEHTDYMVVLQGMMYLGLVDLRPRSSSSGMRCILPLSGDRPCGVLIPPGILHGFFVPEGNLLVWGMSHGWTPDDEIECRWNDPEIGLDWPEIHAPRLSARDREAGSFQALNQAFLDCLREPGLT